jgi:hypothetical protein
MSRIALAVFSVSPTFYAIVAGGLISANVNLLTGLTFSKPILGLASLLSASLLFVLSATLLLYISIRLDDIRSTAANIERRRALLRHNRHLSAFLLASVLLCILGVAILFVGAYIHTS